MFSLNFTKNEYSESLGLLYSKSAISSTAGTIEVLSAVACASRSTLTAETSVATAGHYFFATVSVADRFGNAVNSAIAPTASVFRGPCSSFSSLTPVLTNSTSVSQIFLNIYNVSAQVSYIDDATAQGTQVCLRLFLERSDSICLNATIRVFPDKPCASLSRSVGSYISLGALVALKPLILMNVTLSFVRSDGWSFVSILNCSSGPIWQSSIW